jgi:hypothetical protein
MGGSRFRPIGSRPENREPDITGSIRPNLSQSTLARPRVLVAKWILALFMVCELCGALRARTAHQSLFIGYRKILAHARAYWRQLLSANTSESGLCRAR